MRYVEEQNDLKRCNAKKKVENGHEPLRYRDCAGGQGKETI